MTVHEQNGNLHVWWFPKEFCQSRFGEYSQSGTNSCTLITLILADKVAKMEQYFQGNVDELPRDAVHTFGAAINAGNGVYNRLFDVTAAKERNSSANTINDDGGSVNAASSSARGSNSSKDGAVHMRNYKNLNIPDAMNALRNHSTLNFQIQEWFYTHLKVDAARVNYRDNIALRIAQIFQVGMEFFQQTHEINLTTSSYLFAAIIADSRTVIFVFEFPSSIVTFFDSHQHGHQAGAVIAQCAIEHLHELTVWFVDMQYEVYASQPTLIEISFLTANSPDASNWPRPNKTKTRRQVV